MAKHKSLISAMATYDELAEAEIRYRLLAEAFTDLPQLRSNLNPQLERCKAEIVRLRALKNQRKPENQGKGAEDAKVVTFNAGRFRKSG